MSTVVKRIKVGGRKMDIRLPRKALCVKQPWASLIAAGVKTLECRSWRTSYRGPLTIVASQKPQFSKKRMQELETETGRAYPTGVVIGVVDLVDVRPGKKGDAKQAVCEVLDGYVWVLKNAHFTFADVPVKGRLGIFDL